MEDFLKKKTDHEEENLFSELSFKYMPYWPLFVILIILGIAGAWVYLRFSVPVYESTATILIKDERKGVDDLKGMESLDLFGSTKIVENEIEVLKSHTLAQEVVKKLRLYAPVTEKGKFVSHSAYITSPIQIEVPVPDSLESLQKAEFSYNASTSQVIISNRKYPVNQWVNTSFGTLRFTPNPQYRPDHLEHTYYFSLIPVKRVANGLIGRLDVVASSKQSTVIDLTFKDEIPQRGEDILNGLVSAYNKAAIADKSAMAANTLSFVEDRLHYVIQDLDSIEGKLQQYKSSNHIVDISQQGQQFLEAVGDNDKKISDLSMQEAILNQVESYVNGKAKVGNIVPSTLGVTDPVLSQLLDRLYSAELEYEKMKKLVPENNPMLITLVDEMDKIRPSILENIQNQRRSLQAGKTDLYATNSRFSSMLQTIPQKERELLEISRQQTIKNDIYTFLLRKREEAALSYASTVADSRLVDKAESGETPVSPKRNLVYLIAISIALIVGIVLSSIRRVLSRNILFRSEIEKYTSKPIIGEIPYDKSKTPLVISEGERTIVAEQFRQLRTSLGYMGINLRKKKILVTSSIEGEGKSFVTANLGVSLALTGKKVVYWN